MLQTVWGTVREGKIQLAEPCDLPEGVRVLVTLLTDEESAFWTAVSQQSLAAIWDNAEDDVYAQLLDK